MPRQRFRAALGSSLITLITYLLTYFTGPEGRALLPAENLHLAKMEASPQEPRRGQPAARPLSPSPAVPSSSSAEARYATPGAKAKVPSLDVPTSSTGPYSHRAPTGTWRSSAAASSARQKKELFKWRKGREEALQLDGDRRPGAHRRRHHRAAAPALVDAPPLQSRREQARAIMWSRVAARGANLRRKESGAQTAGFECAVR